MLYFLKKYLIPFFLIYFQLICHAEEPNSEVPQNVNAPEQALAPQAEVQGEASPYPQVQYVTDPNTGITYMVPVDPNTQTQWDQQNIQNAQSEGAPQGVPGEGEGEAIPTPTKMSTTQALQNRLKKKNGEYASIVILSPIDYTTMQLSETAAKSIYKSGTRYGLYNMRVADEVINQLTLEEFRRLTIKLNTDIIMAVIIKPTNFDMFLYDKRTPYYIYAHSEAIPDPRVYRLTKASALHYIKLSTRRIFYRYINDQFYELPRKSAPPVLLNEIPRSIASAENFQRLNRDLLSHFYFAGSIGAALNRGTEGKYWNSNLLAVQLGIRPYGSFYLEGIFEAFAYNAYGFNVKMLIKERDTPYNFVLGLGFSKVDAKKTLNWDQSNGLGPVSNYIVPSGSILFPISDIYLKIEARIFLDLEMKRNILTFMPGIMLMF